MTRHPPSIEALTERLPTTIQAIREYFSTGRISDDLFRDTARLILASAQPIPP
ncbi:hypothetical protein [Subtercola lobariae]|uniref:hypothetical protein n=1 Tax=Subtercola lobariae TaxID=1588641 RepID=UPI0016698919|nr:hypothetical protein [Subtercola lobariae]